MVILKFIIIIIIITITIIEQLASIYSIYYSCLYQAGKRGTEDWVRYQRVTSAPPPQSRLSPSWHQYNVDCPTRWEFRPTSLRINTSISNPVQVILGEWFILMKLYTTLIQQLKCSDFFQGCPIENSLSNILFIVTSIIYFGDGKWVTNILDLQFLYVSSKFPKMNSCKQPCLTLGSAIPLSNLKVKMLKQVLNLQSTETDSLQGFRLFFLMHSKNKVKWKPFLTSLNYILNTSSTEHNFNCLLIIMGRMGISFTSVATSWWGEPCCLSLCFPMGTRIALPFWILTIWGSVHIEETLVGWRNQLRMKTSAA